jgi:hypothetical protein
LSEERVTQLIAEPVKCGGELRFGGWCVTMGGKILQQFNRCVVAVQDAEVEGQHDGALEVSQLRTECRADDRYG